MGKGGRRIFSHLEVVLIVLFVLMTGISVGVITLIFVNINAQRTSGPTTTPMSITVSTRDSGWYLIGVGRADCTGPLADAPLMGFAKAGQLAGGLHTRQYSRAFIVAEPDSSRRVVLVSVDIGMVSQRLRLEVMKQLNTKYGDLYRQDNVILSGTHTHSGPAGYFQYTLFMISGKGFIKPTFDALVNGIIKSVDLAHQNMKSGRILVNKGDVENSQINRSPFSYLQNPEPERHRYPSNTDKEMVVLKMVDINNQPLGTIWGAGAATWEGGGIQKMIDSILQTTCWFRCTTLEFRTTRHIHKKEDLANWFAVHPVSMNNSNHLVSSDNMGYASYLFEQEQNKGQLPGQGPFVAAFASSNLGDVSPNIQGPHCINTGESCDNPHSYCPDGGAKMCMAMGPGKDIFESTRIIGENIYSKAKELYRTASVEIKGPILSAHQWVDMSNVTVQLNSTHTGNTCKPALGYSFAAGTIDGVGALNFTQGTVEGDPFWDTVRDMLLHKPSNETVDCHNPKPILFSTGEMLKPLPWHPDIVDIQMITIGSLAIAAIPGEFTTMSGRRLREAIKKEFETEGKPGMNVIISGLCNVYTHYITTYEEYQVQRYEGASTIYGPHTLSAYVHLYNNLAKAIAKDTVSDLPKGPEPPFFDEKKLIVLLFNNPIDKTPENMTFGSVLQDVQPLYKLGNVAEITFVSANPRNSVYKMDTHTFLTVEKYENDLSKWANSS